MKSFMKTCIVKAFRAGSALKSPTGREHATSPAETAKAVQVQICTQNGRASWKVFTRKYVQ